MAPSTKDNEVLPLDADQIDTLVPPREQGELFGHGAVCDALETAISAGSLHHALLFHGPEGIGKATLAFLLARRLIIGKADETQPVNAGSSTPEKTAGFSGFCSPGLKTDIKTGEQGQISALSHPNLLVMQKRWDLKKSRFTTGIDIEQVRKLGRFSGLTAAREGARVVIIDRVEHLNNAAANALLKTLEEPPAGLQFILVASEMGMLPPTIASRCHALSFAPLSVDEIMQAVRSVFTASRLEVPDPQRLEQAAAGGRGSVRRTLQMLVGDGLEIRKMMLDILQNLPDLPMSRLMLLVDKVTAKGNENGFDILFDNLQYWLSDKVRDALAQPQTIKQNDKVYSPDPVKLATLWADMTRQKAQLVRLNLDRRIFLLDSFKQIAQVMKKPS